MKTSSGKLNETKILNVVLIFSSVANLLLSCHAADLPLPPPPQDTPVGADPDAKATKRLAWWTDARFGMFVHWGLYSQWGCHYPGTNGELIDGGSEHMMQHLKIPLVQYAKIADVFDPTNFNANQWVSIAKEAGMRYIVITAKHHDGFAMFNSPSSGYDIVSRTPWHSDPIKELADACHRQGLRFGVYYSLGRDWQDPDVPTKNGYRSNTWDYPDETNKVFSRYFERKVKPQITELLTQYGPIDVVWFDTPEKISKSESKELVNLIHKLQPACIINSRVGNGYGDYNVEEQKIPANGANMPWETCMTLNGHWGYFLGDEKWKSPKIIIRNLIDIASKGGNYLLNVGPTGTGVIPRGAVDDLNRIGAWMKINGQTIYGTTKSPLSQQPSWGRVTQKADILYLHVFDWPPDGKIMIPGLKDKIRDAMMLATGEKLKTSRDPEGVTIFIPTTEADTISSTILLQFNGEPEIE